MNISFIVTAYNIEPYIAECLNSLRPCLRPGDQLIIIDDGSTDQTLDILQRSAAQDVLEPGIDIEIIAFGTNTHGGVGIPANIGLDHATCDAVFFVDGDDYMIPEGFLRARAEFERRDLDVLICNYLEYDQKQQRTKKPSDAWRWKNLPGSMDLGVRRMQALSMIAVPWRKFYKRSFLNRHQLRFPEGDYFFEDNPFHWEVCRHASSIGFLNSVVCHHRVNRPGQTMASTGTELTAFFTHYRTIMGRLSSKDAAYAAEAARWLINQISWHLSRLRPAAFLPYAQQAEATLKSIDDPIWSKVGAEFSATNVWSYADRLRRGHIWEVVESWRGEHRQNMMAQIEEKLDQAIQRIGELEVDVRKIRKNSQAEQVVAEFEALKALMNQTSHADCDDLDGGFFNSRRKLESSQLQTERVSEPPLWKKGASM